MASEQERVGAYLDTVQRLEPNITMIDAGAGWASTAISAKRMADDVHRMANALTEYLQWLRHKDDVAKPPLALGQHGDGLPADDS